MMTISGIVIAGMLLVASTGAFSQTGMIAHRSHSGSGASFDPRGGDGFGLPPKHIDSVVRISDTSTLEFSNYGADTVYNGNAWNDPKLSLDSLQRAFPKIRFIGFEEAEKQAHAGPQPMPSRGVAAAGPPPSTGRGVLLLAILGALAIPSLAYGIWRAETRRSA
jgi:hypothetical protein